MNMDPSAVTILYYNKLNLTRRCVGSVMNTGMDPGTILLLDNGSRPEVFRSITAEYPDCRHVRLEENRGFSGGFNAALTAAFDHGFSSALFLTNDTEYCSGALSACRRAAASANAGLAAPRIHYLSNPDAVDSLGAWFDPATAALNHCHTDDLPPLLSRDNWEYMPGTALWIHRDAFQRLGGADTSFHTYWEDVDLCMRAHALEIPMIRAQDARIGHGVGRTCHKKPLYTTYLFQRNRIKFCRAHLSGEQLAVALRAVRSDLSAMTEKFRANNDLRRLAYLHRIESEMAF